MSSQELHHGSNSVHFFKIILQTTLQKGKLRVPIKIKYPLRETSEEYEDVEESDCSLKIIEDPSSSRGKRTKSPMPSSKLSKKMKINPKESKHEKRIVQTHGSSCDNLKKRSNDLFEKVMTNFDSDKNFFACILQKSYIERDVLVIPIEFAKTHLQRMEGRNVTLFVDKDRTWNVDLKLASNKQFTLSGGWSKFRTHYNLKFGDVCVFVLNKCKGSVSFQVVIFSLEKDMNTPYFQGYCEGM
ncbi:hypothetical protein P8452_01229 [Trifolium repens]|nr:hypothetical protein P8452_01229 [Trifolium repens]